jgi:soluble lytic murein transglycosylase-like protein
MSTMTRHERITRALACLRACPFIFRLQACLLAAAVLATAWVSTVAANRDVVVAALEVPADELDRLPWPERVDRFSSRIAFVFDLEYDVAREYAGWILDSASRHGLQPELLAGVVYVESRFRRNARSARGAIGPAQVMPLWSDVCAGDLRRPADNIDCGARVLAHYLAACGDIDCALAAYNVGPTNRARYARSGARYVAKVDAHAERLRDTL